jgi:hypothetical protein
LNASDAVLELDWAGDLVWEYRNPMLRRYNRLANGNTLITEGAPGRIFEVTSGGEVVWEYLNPFNVSGAQGTSSGVFRAHRYEPRPSGSGRQRLGLSPL